MPNLPLVARVYTYTGRDERRQIKTAEKNRYAYAAVRLANELVAKNSSDIQQLYFASLAAQLRCDVEIVRHALSEYGGFNGFTIRVDDEDRLRLQAAGFVA